MFIYRIDCCALLIPHQRIDNQVGLDYVSRIVKISDRQSFSWLKSFSSSSSSFVLVRVASAIRRGFSFSPRSFGWNPEKHSWSGLSSIYPSFSFVSIFSWYVQCGGGGCFFFFFSASLPGRRRKRRVGENLRRTSEIMKLNETLQNWKKKWSKGTRVATLCLNRISGRVCNCSHETNEEKRRIKPWDFPSNPSPHRESPSKKPGVGGRGNGRRAARNNNRIKDQTSVASEKPQCRQCWQ